MSLQRTVLHSNHLAAGAKLVDFAGWEMPLQYSRGILHEHLAVRKGAGLFDVSHMGRFAIRGSGALGLLQHTLSNDSSSLQVGQSQYTLLPTPTGGAIDDAYLYRFVDDEYLLVVNASNRAKDYDHLSSLLNAFGDVYIEDRSDDLAMLALQGPASEMILTNSICGGQLPPHHRNALSACVIDGFAVLLARTGYTGEPICFELFCEASQAPALWDLLLGRGAQPIGLGARDTLRLEAGLPLYGHELGTDSAGREIPIFAVRSAKAGVSLSPVKGDFIGRSALTRQHDALANSGTDATESLPRRVLPLAILDNGVARAGAPVFQDQRPVGYVTSGTAVPYWKSSEESFYVPSDESATRPIALALLEGDIHTGQRLTVQVRSQSLEAISVPGHIRLTDRYAQPIIYDNTWSPHARETHK